MSHCMSSLTLSITKASKYKNLMLTLDLIVPILIGKTTNSSSHALMLVTIFVYDEGNILCWNSFLFKYPPYDISRYCHILSSNQYISYIGISLSLSYRIKNITSMVDLSDKIKLIFKDGWRERNTKGKKRGSYRYHHLKGKPSLDPSTSV
jgi:hypothetical protein